MPKYAIMSEKKVSMPMEEDVVKDGVVYQVILQSDNGKSEVQEYFVAEGEKATEVLAAAARNYEAAQVEIAVEMPEPQEFKFVTVK